MILALVRLATGVLDRLSKKQSLIYRGAQTQRGWNVSAQVGRHDTIVDDAILVYPSSVGRQGDVNDAIQKSECGCNLVKNEWGVWGVSNVDGNLAGWRTGVVCHDGSYKFFKWDATLGCMVPFELSNPVIPSASI
jgi:hypothetical protein